MVKIIKLVNYRKNNQEIKEIDSDSIDFFLRKNELKCEILNSGKIKVNDAINF